MYVKDLKIVREDLARVILIDDSPTAASMHQQNTLPIESFYGDAKDTALPTLIPSARTGCRYRRGTTRSPLRRVLAPRLAGRRRALGERKLRASRSRK